MGLEVDALVSRETWTLVYCPHNGNIVIYNLEFFSLLNQAWFLHQFYIFNMFFYGDFKE
ncbi:unnamed protein product [Spirodela intermedia]|uniref:Uncharacterized protein n=1 Tax=Spirodela intermedia TaxID=51605 RepID=A0A7I8IHY8_SPIIN|nr:unnamed protein product [Spirodela intermedia]CAA6656482.1 unnamed protein product [Spirodela intermedia]